MTDDAAERRKSDQHRDSKKGALERLLSSIAFLLEPQLPVEDRRKVGRIACTFPTSFVTETGLTGTAEVLDVSRRGLGLRSRSALSKGLTLALKPPALLEGDFAPIMARVVWSQKEDQGYRCGVMLPPGLEDEPTWLEAYLLAQGAAPNEPQRRRFVRASSDLPGRLEFPDAPAVAVTIVNLGMGGALLRADQTLSGSSFQLSFGPWDNLPALELSGTLLRHTRDEQQTYHFYSSRFGPLEERRHSLLKEYIVHLLRNSERDRG